MSLNRIAPLPQSYGAIFQGRHEDGSQQIAQEEKTDLGEIYVSLPVDYLSDISLQFTAPLRLLLARFHTYCWNQQSPVILCAWLSHSILSMLLCFIFYSLCNPGRAHCDIASAVTLLWMFHYLTTFISRVPTVEV